MRARLVVGLPGSGKTTWATAEVARLCAAGTKAALLDDPRTQEDLERGLAHARAEGVELLFFTDPYLCEQIILERATQLLQDRGYEVSYVFFENRPEQCLENAEARDGRSAERRASLAGLIGYLAPLYQIPPGAQIVPVFGS